MGKLPPFKPFPFSWRERVLSELSGAQLKVWMAHYWRSGKDNKVETSNAQIQRTTGLSHNTVDIAKRWLKHHGWLVVDKAAYRDPLTQQWAVAEFTATVPDPDFRGALADPENRGTGPAPDLGVRTSPDFAGTAESGSSVDTGFRVDTSESDAPRLPVNTTTAEVEEAASASAEVAMDEDLKRYSVETELLPIAKDYNLNVRCKEEAEKLYDLLEEIHYPGNLLGAAIEYHRSISDTFMADRIATWGGLLKMLRSGGVIQQFRSAQKLALKLNSTAYHQAQSESFGTPAYGAAIAKIIENKKAGKKKNPAYHDGSNIAKEVPSAVNKRGVCPHGIQKTTFCDRCIDDYEIVRAKDAEVDEL
jgi:hypothetical protein